MTLLKKLVSWTAAIFLLTLTVGCEFPEGPEREEEDRFNVPQMHQQ